MGLPGSQRIHLDRGGPAAALWRVRAGDVEELVRGFLAFFGRVAAREDGTG